MDLDHGDLALIVQEAVLDDGDVHHHLPHGGLAGKHLSALIRSLPCAPLWSVFRGLIRHLLQLGHDVRFALHLALGVSMIMSSAMSSGW